MDRVARDIVLALETRVESMTDREFALLTSILLNIVEAKVEFDSFALVNGLAKILSNSSNDDIQRSAIKCLQIVSVRVNNKIIKIYLESECDILKIDQTIEHCYVLKHMGCGQA